MHHEGGANGSTSNKQARPEPHNLSSAKVSDCMVSLNGMSSGQATVLDPDRVTVACRVLALREYSVHG